MLDNYTVAALKPTAGSSPGQVTKSTPRRTTRTVTRSLPPLSILFIQIAYTDEKKHGDSRL